MRSITFCIRSEVPAARLNEVVSQLAAVPGVQQAQLIDPNSKSLAIRRLGHAYVADEVDMDEVLRNVSAVPEVETASVPSQRRLR